MVRRRTRGLKTRIGNERDYCGRPWQVRKEGSLPWLAPASVARTTERLSRRKHEVLMPLCRYKRQYVIRKKKGSVAKRCNWVCTLLLIHLYFFFLHIHVRSTLTSTSKHTPLPEGSTMAAPAPHLSKGNGKKKKKHQRQNR